MKSMGLFMEKKNLKNEKRINISEMPEDKTFKDYPKDTIFVLDEDDILSDESFWENEE